MMPTLGRNATPRLRRPLAQRRPGCFLPVTQRGRTFGEIADQIRLGVSRHLIGQRHGSVVRTVQHAIGLTRVEHRGEVDALNLRPPFGGDGVGKLPVSAG